MSAWQKGRAEVDALFGSGRVEHVPPDLDGALALVVRARTHLRSAAVLADDDVELAYDALHAANRKALTAVLLAQGLRPTREGCHTAVHEVVRAQLVPPLGAVLAPYSRIRRMRNAGDYLGELPATSSDVHADLPDCAAIVDAAEKVLGRMPVY
jgi:hypothetical protein